LQVEELGRGKFGIVLLALDNHHNYCYFVILSLLTTACASGCLQSLQVSHRDFSQTSALSFPLLSLQVEELGRGKFGIVLLAVMQ
jgi:hypothetical protein